MTRVPTCQWAPSMRLYGLNLPSLALTKASKGPLSCKCAFIREQAANAQQRACALSCAKTLSQ